MSNKSKKRNKKKRAKVKVLTAARIEPKKTFVALEVEHSEELPELSTWAKLSKFMGWS